ncbi:MAG: NAD(P)/FAD-dependent oxidoreductase [Steroidobacteraceae bacterium]|jgi:flavin-dependent dehydrogenase
MYDTDVIVIGGGPAGSTAATLLTQRGYRVALFEKDHHPRFHIGESLLPANLPLLERLGVADQVRSIGMRKWGAEFVSHWDGRRQDFRFAEAWNKSMPMAYQVRRSVFDEILIRRAAQVGAEVIEGARVREVDIAGDTAPGGAPTQMPVRAQVQYDDGRVQAWQARFLVDASGRDTFLANRLQVKRRDPKHNSAAIFGHFSGAQRYAGEREGHISIYWFDHGWFWFIPLSDGATSVGAVVWPYYLKSRTVPVRDFLLATIALCPPLAQRLSGAQLISEVQATGNYSYHCTRSHGARYLLLGDAYAFIDPMFSSGVMLAMHSAFAGAETVDTCLREPARAAAALRAFDQTMRRGPREYSWFIYRVTSPTMREMFLGPRNIWRVKEALLSLLAGDIFGATPIWTSLRGFKLLYRLISLRHPGRSAHAWRRRRVNIQPADPGPLTAS